jgi:N-acetylglutamate synthase-like GNAT family acetyltransferase
MPAPGIRTATIGDAAALHALIASNQAEGHLLPRSVDEIRRHAPNFIVYEDDGRVKACAELAPLSSRLAEIRSLVVASDVRHRGVAARLVGELRARARAAGFESLCALTHDARIFIRHDFSIVPHVWLPEKIARDCQGCPLFRQCGQHAMLLPLKDLPRVGGARPFSHPRIAVA